VESWCDRHGIRKKLLDSGFSSISRRRTLRLLVYEHASGGGLTDGSIPSDVLSEGFGMLRSIISDFKAAGHNVTTLLNSRLAAFNPPIAADNVLPILSWQEAKTSIERVAGEFDAAYVIGPETNQTLQSVIETAEEAGLTLLNCAASTIGEVVGKLTLHRCLKKKGIESPETVMYSVFDEVEDIKQALQSDFSYPMVFKPLDGVSSSGLSLVENEAQIEGAIAKIKRESTRKDFVVQQYVQGIAASVSLITTGKEALPISLNKQILLLAGPESDSAYMGGSVPFDSPFVPEAFKLAKKTVESFSGLRGYVGVDLVLTEKGPLVIEVNPRLTTSYVGLKHAADFNIAKAITDAVLEGTLPDNIQFTGYSSFSKFKVHSPTIVALQNAYGLEELISPPFPMGDANAYALLLCHRATLNESIKGLHDAEERLLRIYGREHVLG
jgi:predicted ATP-grasp superfamily ATP-dependent carboligase